MLDELPAPNLWSEIEARAVATQRLSNRTYPFALIGAVLLLLAMIWAVGPLGSGGAGVPVQTVSPAASTSPSPTPRPAAPGRWTATASMIQARHGHTATLLPDGRVLVAGGLGADTGLASAELYDPRTMSWTATGTMVQGRAWHSATLLTNGTVLVVGGTSVVGTAPGTDLELASAELYDPRTGSWTTTTSMAEARSGPAVVLLPDGRVLAAGGWGSTAPFGPKLASAEVYDPVSGTWTPTAPMGDARHGQVAALLPSGIVLVAGGYNDSVRLASAELYDPATGTWTPTGSLPEPFNTDTAILLATSHVLIAGGDVPSGPGAIGSAHAALYDPVTGTWTTTGPLYTPRLAHTATLLPDGRVLVSGGRVNGGPTAGTFASAELYDPVTGTWAASGDMTVTRSGQTATLLLDGQVLIAGGASGTEGDVLASAELFALLGGS